MKVRYSDRRQWKEKVRVEHIYIDEERYRGYITVTIIDDIPNPLCWKVPEGYRQDLCIADKGYRWIQFYPEGEWYSLIAILDNNLNFIQFYVDLSMPYEVEDGVVVTKDLYLDYFIDWEGNYIELDIDEYEEAVDRGELDKELAQRTMEVFTHVGRAIEAGSFPSPFVKQWLVNYCQSNRDNNKEK